jgi:hypothetical protein
LYAASPLNTNGKPVAPVLKVLDVLNRTMILSLQAKALACFSSSAGQGAQE